MQHHPAQDTVAARAAQNVIGENEKIFPIFAQRLASNEPKEFISIAQKLATWLSSEKAYYQAARPKIVELLEIALSAFMNTFACHPLITEIGIHLRRLVQAVIPFKHLFRENELQSRLQRVIIDTTLSLSRTSAATYITTSSEGSVAVDPPCSTHAPLVDPQPISSPILDCHSSGWRVSPSASMASVEQATSVVLVPVGQSLACNHPDVASPSQIETQSFSSPVTNTPDSAEVDVSPTVAPKPLPKRARRAGLSEELIARDLDWFRSNQDAVVNKDSSASLFTPGESSSLSSDTPHIPGRTTHSKKKTARMVPSRHLPRRISLNATQGVKSEAAARGPASEPLAKMDEFSENAQDDSAQVAQMNVDEGNLSIEMMGSIASGNIQQVSLEDLPSLELQPVTTPPIEHSIEQQTPQTDHQSSAVDDGSLVTGNSSMSDRPFLPPPEVALDDVESMDIAASEPGPARLRFQSQDRPGSTTSQSPRMPHLQNPVLPEPPLDLNFRISRTPGLPLQLGVDTVQRQFNDEMVVLHSMQGKAFTHTHVFDINLSESTFSKISKWVNRRSHPSEASQGACIALACYHLLEFFDAIKSQNEKLDVEKLALQMACSWPSSNQLSLRIKNRERHTTITLSPPLSLTPDRCVDISSLMKPGDNTLEITQKDDLSEYLIALHARPPATTQLIELEAVRGADKRWMRFLDVLSGRVVPEKTFDDSPVGIVGVCP